MQCRWAPSLGKLEGTHQEAWGTGEYESRYEQTVFFGMYDLRDYIALWRHKGPKWILWAGSDIRNLLRGFVLNDGKLRYISAFGGNRWIYKTLEHAEHWVENYVERDALRAVGIEARVCPSFMGKISDFEITYKPSENPKVYLCSPEGRQIEYGFDVVERIASALPSYSFHLYGSKWKTKYQNVFVHGRVSKDQMNKEIKDMQVGLRLNAFEGFSEIIAKAILMGQIPVSRIEYPGIPKCETDNEIMNRIEYPNFTERDWYIENLNSYPWVS